MRTVFGLSILVYALVASTAPPLSAAELPDAATIKKLFANPPREYSSAPLWVWNDMLTEDQIRQTMQDLAGQKVKQVFVHPRPGLMTPYLSADWFRLWKVALKEAERLDMNVWIYDENSYPSGFAGGHVPEAMPESRGRGLHFTEGPQPKLPAEGLLGVFQLEGDKATNVTDKARNDVGSVVNGREKLPDGKYLVAEVRRAKNNPWHGNRAYVDLLYPGVTQKFLDVTLEPYRREFGDQFGKRIPGAFTDEPQLRPAGGLPWTDDLPQEFQKRYGYSLTENLASLVRPVGEWKKVRHDYYQLLLGLMIDRWAKPYYDYCERNKLEFTGHYWEHEWPNCVSVPDNMAMYAWHQRPSIDCLMNQYQTDTHAQFGNVRAVKELSSVANQLGRKRTLCELYGAGGWDLRFEDMKRIADWLAVLGVNTMDEHLSYVTIRGARKWDHPQSFSYHEPWWDSYHKVAEYLTRLSLVASAGEQVNRVLVLEPTSTAWLYQSDPTQAAKLKQLGDDFQSLLNELEKAQVEYDIGCEDIIARHGSVKDRQLVVGKRAYDYVVIPPGMDNLNGKVAKWCGARVFYCGETPALLDGCPVPDDMKGGEDVGWTKSSPAKLPMQLLATSIAEQRERGEPIVTVTHDSAADGSILFHQRRRLADGETIFLVNTSMTSVAKGRVKLSRGPMVHTTLTDGETRVGRTTPLRDFRFEEWSLENGQCRTYPVKKDSEFVCAEFTLPACGSLVLFVSDKAGEPLAEKKPAVKAIAATGEVAVARKDPNVLALDYFDVTAGGQTRQNLHCYQACQFAFKQNGMERNPWDSAVQFKDELITKKFPPESGCAATYRFTIEQQVPKDLTIVIERPDLYAITCNGQPMKPLPDQWWLDRAFGKIDLAKAVKVGENEVTITAKPFTIYHELMPAYVLGDFSLKPVEKGFAIAPPQPLKLGKWNEQGLPLYGHGVGYSQTFEVAKPSGRYAVKLGEWNGSVAKVVVNGKPAGAIGWAPWTCDVTDAIQPGKNTVEVIVIGTLRNTLGPHHAGPVAGKAWPHDFRKAPEIGPPPGAQYNTLPYGLYTPFALEQVSE